MTAVPTVPDWTAGQRVLASQLEQLTTAIRFGQNPPIALLYQSATQTFSNNTNAAVALDATAWDTASGHNNATNNTRYTAVYPGTYNVTGHVSWPQNATGARQLEIYKNGSVYNTGSQIFAGQSTNWTAHETTVEVAMVVGDYVEMWVEQLSGGSLTLNSGTAPYQTYMQIQWIHA